MILRLWVAVLVFFGLLHVCAAQTPANQLDSEAYVFSSSDIKSVLTKGEREKLSKYQRELRELQTLGRSLPKDSDNRADLAALFNRKKKERDKEFEFIRGINGMTVTLWGPPMPAPSQIVSIIVMERRTGAGDGIVWPHWHLDRGALIGSQEAPRGRQGGADIPAGPTVDLGRFNMGAAQQDRMLSPTSCDEEPPADMVEPICECEDRNLLFGTPTTQQCFWRDLQ